MPITKAQKVVCKNDQESLDFIMDLKIENTDKILNGLYKLNEMKFLLFNCRTSNAFAVLIFKPIELWQDYKNQNFLCYIGPTIDSLINIFNSIKMRSQNYVELFVISQMLRLLTALSKQYKPTC